MQKILKLLTIITAPFIIGLSIPEKKPSFDDLSHFTPNPEHLDGRFTGGFGEETCRSCHFDYDLNMDGGILKIEGLNDSYQAGKSYEVTVTLQAEQLEVGGFQLTTRFEDGSQAGEFKWNGDRLMFTPSISDEVKYLQHSAEGTSLTGDREVQWVFSWTAPSSGKPVVINIAANSGNYDDSSFGDWIYATELILKPE